MPYSIISCIRSGGAISAQGDEAFTVAEECLFRENLAAAKGGAVALQGGSFSAIGCSFSENAVVFTGEGGAIAASRGDATSAPVVTVVGGDLRGNAAEGGFGGAVFGTEGATVSFEDVQVRAVEFTTFPKRIVDHTKSVYYEIQKFTTTL